MKYSNITTMEQFKNFLKDVDAAETWDAFETEEWESACEFAGINYHDYDDPDFLFDDLQKFAERKKKTMTKLMDTAGNVFAKGESISEIMEELNYDPNGNNEWRYYYRPDVGVVNAYFGKDGKADYSGEEADATYDVVED